MILTYGSVCSGIETASVAWAPLGWRPAWETVMGEALAHGVVAAAVALLVWITAGGGM